MKIMMKRIIGWANNEKVTLDTMFRRCGENGLTDGSAMSREDLTALIMGRVKEGVKTSALLKSIEDAPHVEYFAFDRTGPDMHAEPIRTKAELAEALGVKI